MKKLIITIIIVALGALTASVADYNQQIEEVHGKIDRQRRELEILDKELGKYRKNINTLDKKEAELLKLMESNKRQIESKKAQIDKLEKKVDEVNNRIDKLNGRLEKAREKHRQYGGYLKDILVEYYYQKFCEDATPWYALSDSTGIIRCYHTESMVKEPARRYKSAAKNIEEYLEIKDALYLQQQNLISLKEQVGLARREFMVKKEEQLEILKDIKKSKQKQLNEVCRLESEKERLSNLIESLKTRAVNLERLKGIAENFEEAKGYLPSPLKGTIVSRFGRQNHPELNTYVVNRGIKIVPADGSRAVKAVAGGEVIYADTFNGMGNMVVISHGKNYYTIYANLSEFGVKEGYEIEMYGEVGKVSDKPFYFELGRGPTPLNPEEWLKK
ncbi:MAG: peptidoglycan DD-metalloendopeptidase family protein [Elusimicrobiota bacterium]|nr:peptidoglycan DD-metalloendopeptidase family protein [Elusimicrobiota bacterium]